jgi:hypothetical protein
MTSTERKELRNVLDREYYGEFGTEGTADILLFEILVEMRKINENLEDLKLIIGAKGM